MPTPSFVRAWAYSGDSEPDQDWDVLLAEFGYVPLLFELIADPQCPGRSSLLGALYCFVGHTDHQDADLNEAVVEGMRSSCDWIRTWAERAAAVIAAPDTFESEDWCSWHGLRQQPIPPE